MDPYLSHNVLILLQSKRFLTFVSKLKPPCDRQEPFYPPSEGVNDAAVASDLPASHALSLPRHGME